MTDNLRNPNNLRNPDNLKNLRNPDKLRIPFVLEPSQTTNYFQIVANLRKLQMKNGKYSVLPVRTTLVNLLKPAKHEYSIESILNGFVYEKLKERLNNHEKNIEKQFNIELKNCLKRIRKQNEITLTSSKVNMDMSQFEETFDILPNEDFFNNPMLYDIFIFLTSSTKSCGFDQEVSYLGIEYLKYIDRFLKENSSDIIAPLKTYEDKISVFVKMKYSSEEYKLEVFEGRYLFAEIYIYLRCGMTNSIFNLLEQYSVFFDHIEAEFKKSLSVYVTSKVFMGSIGNIGQCEDRFKKILYDLMQGKKNIEDHLVISSVEDYLWFQLINIKDSNDLKVLRKQFENYKSKKGLLLVYLMTKQYEKAMEFIYYNDFPTYSTYHLMKELAKRSKDKNLFVDFTFLLCMKMKNVQKKVDCISILEQVVENYTECVSNNIVKYKIFDVLGQTLSKEIDMLVVRQLKDMNDRKQLLKVYKLVEDSYLLSEILADIFIEGILTNANIDESVKIYLEIKKTDESQNIAKLDVLLKFYYFLQNPDIFTLKRTSFFSADFRLIEVKFVVEKVLKVACEVIKRANDYEMAKNLFRVVGEIELSDECIKYINKELVLFI